jgi:hypothetical protein
VLQVLQVQHGWQGETHGSTALGAACSNASQAMPAVQRCWCGAAAWLTWWGGGGSPGGVVVAHLVGWWWLTWWGGGGSPGGVVVAHLVGRWWWTSAPGLPGTQLWRPAAAHTAGHALKVQCNSRQAASGAAEVQHQLVLATR